MLAGALSARTSKEDLPSQATAAASYCIGTHDVGRLVCGISNIGVIGYGKGRGSVTIDCFTGARSASGEYPKGANRQLLYKGALWVGGVLDRDTLVSHAGEFNNTSREFHPISEMIYRTSLDETNFYYNDAVSEQDFVAVMVDTFTSGVGNGSWDPIENRRHKPLNLHVTQTSYSWSYGHTDDFIIWNYRIRNIGDRIIRDAYLGVYWDADVAASGSNLIFAPPEIGKGVTDGRDDLSGYLFEAQSPFEHCESSDTIGLAWTADNDGDPKSGAITLPDVGGIRILGTQLTNPALKVSYNWYTYNYNSFYEFGPQRDETYRWMGNGTGTPYGDRNKYHLLSNGEIDYDQAYTRLAIENNPGWSEANIRLQLRAVAGVDVQQVLAVGPYDIQPGGVVELPIAFVGGEDLHNSVPNYKDNLLRHYTPDIFYANLDFSHLIRNAITANRVYDIPGFDTNDDGYLGKFRTCVYDSELVDDIWVPTVAETTYYEGDGFPDFRAAAPPPSPPTWLYPTLNGIRVRFNGSVSENTLDVFSDLEDFEGYRVYIARDNREESFSLVAQYDRRNFDKYIYTIRRGHEPEWIRLDNPLSIDSLRCLYGQRPEPCADSSFDPLRYTPSGPYFHPEFPDSIFYFTTHDYNQYELGIHSPIKRIYPDQPPPTSLLAPQPDELTEDGYLKYYEYEIVIDNLLASVPYNIAVTAFDFGSPRAGLAPLESSKTLVSHSAYPDSKWDLKPDSLTNIYVYPNPYRQDDWYRQTGYEGRGQDYYSRDRVRKVTFANLPPKCNIKIFTLDGDLVRSMDHDVNSIDPSSSYHEWNLVSRNVQLVVSGIYYWVVEDPNGNTQIGKLVILL